MAGRIKIGPYKPLDVHTPAVAGGGYINVDASVGKFEPSPLARLGLDVAQGLPAIAATVAEQLPRDNEAAVKVADTRLGETEQALLFDPQDGYFNTHGETALTKAPEVLDAYTKAQEREVDALPNDAQRQMLEELAQRRLMTFGEQVERHSVAERQRWYDAAGDRRIAQMRTDAGFYWSDDALLRRALGTTRAEVRDKAERHGWDSPLTEAALRQQTSRTLVSAIEAAVERDPRRAQALRTRYDHHIEAPDRVALDALLSEAQTRQRAQAASAEILTATPPDGEPATPQWRLRQAEAITDPDVRAATIRRVRGAAAAAEARARTLGEQVLVRVLKDHLTDPSQIPVREWVALDAKHRQAIETRVDHNARGTEPAANPALVDELATAMTQAPGVFARRDLVPLVAQLPLPQWQRFHDWQAGLRRNDPTTEDELYAIKRGLQLAITMLPPDTTGDSATNYRADLVEEIGTWCKVTGKSPDDAAIADMLKRRIPTESYATRTLEGDPRHPPETHQIRADTTTYWPNLHGLRRILGAVVGAEASRAFGEAMRSMARGVQGDTEAFARVVGREPAKGYPTHINREGGDVYYNPQTGRFLVRNMRGGLGFWIEFDAKGELVGAVDMTLDYPTPRDQLSPKQVEEWTKPETFPQADPLPQPEGLTPAPPLERPEGFTPAPPLPRPEGFARPDIDIPLYVEAEWEWHHHLPQQWWNPDRQHHLSFSPRARKFFDKQIIRVPRGEHWGGLHAAYNRAVGRALKKYLASKPAGHAKNMSKEQAEECYNKVMEMIRNQYSKYGKEDKKAIDDAKKAKEFYDKIISYA